jgi:tRNA threonylcarbamoyladenosine biosynthesis protein TsaB
MKVLGIDTATPVGSVGLVDDGGVIAEVVLNPAAPHSERVLKAIQTVLEEGRCGLEAVDGWAVSLGPGSFTGLRVGVSTAKGLAFATGKPIAGMNTLDVVASQVSPTPFSVCTVLDARKKEVYAAFYRMGDERGLERVSPVEAISPESLVRRVREPTVFVGNGCCLYRGFLREALGKMALFAPDLLNHPRGASVAQLGLRELARGSCLDLASFAPFYVRPSEAEAKWRETHDSALLSSGPLG